VSLGADPYAERPPIRVLIADDHPVFRSGLRTLVEESPGLTFAGEAANGTGPRRLRRTCAGRSPDGHPYAGHQRHRRRLTHRQHIPLGRRPDAQHAEDDTSVFAAMRASARGYVLKGAAPHDIVRAIIAVAAGEVILGAALAVRISDFFQSETRRPPSRSQPCPAANTTSST
jgi:DNA-binding NarL/FixJ family response regulator